MLPFLFLFSMVFNGFLSFQLAQGTERVAEENETNQNNLPYTSEELENYIDSLEKELEQFKNGETPEKDLFDSEQQVTYQQVDEFARFFATAFLEFNGKNGKTLNETIQNYVTSDLLEVLEETHDVNNGRMDHETGLEHHLQEHEHGDEHEHNHNHHHPEDSHINIQSTVNELNVLVEENTLDSDLILAHVVAEVTSQMEGQPGSSETKEVLLELRIEHNDDGLKIKFYRYHSLTH